MHAVTTAICFACVFQISIEKFAICERACMEKSCQQTNKPHAHAKLQILYIFAILSFRSKSKIFEPMQRVSYSVCGPKWAFRPLISKYHAPSFFWRLQENNPLGFFYKRFRLLTLFARNHGQRTRINFICGLRCTVSLQIFQITFLCCCGTVQSSFLKASCAFRAISRKPS